MNKRSLVIALVLFAFLTAAMVEVAYENTVYMPAVYNPPEPTATITPTLRPTPTSPPSPTPSPTPSYTGNGYNWVYIGIAQLSKNRQTVDVLGKMPGVCYNVEIDQYTEDGMVLLRSHELVLGTYPCSVPPYNPDGIWPPIQFPPPPDPLPADWDWFLYGEVYRLVIPESVKVVCGAGESVFGTTNCFKVIRPNE